MRIISQPYPQAPNARGSADCGQARQATLYTNFASKKYLKNGAVASRLQALGAIRSPETGFDRGMGGKERTLFFDNSNSMWVR